jgi:hypothetical protein
MNIKRKAVALRVSLLILDIGNAFHGRFFVLASKPSLPILVEFDDGDNYDRPQLPNGMSTSLFMKRWRRPERPMCSHIETRTLRKCRCFALHQLSYRLEKWLYRVHKSVHEKTTSVMNLLQERKEYKHKSLLIMNSEQ